MRIANAVIALLLLAAALWAVDRNGFARCERAVAAAQQTQQAADRVALAEMVPRQQQREADYDKQQMAIRAVPDPVGCALAVVPAERVGRLHDLYTLGARPGADGPR